MADDEMKIIHRIAISVVAVAVILIAAVIGWTIAEPSTEQTKPDPEPLVINTVEDGDDMLLTVIRDNGDTVFQYEGDLDIWKGADGKAYGIIYLHEEVLQ